MRAGGDGQPLRGSETSDGSDVRYQMTSRLHRQSILRLCCTAAGPQLFFENPVIVINLRDLSTPRSCSDFADRVMRHANTARDDDIRQVSDGVAAQLLKASFLGRRGCFGRALRCLLGVQERLAKEPGLGILCRMPTEDPRAGPQLIGQPPKGKRFDVQKKRQLAAGLQVLCRTCTLLLHTKAPSFLDPAGGCPEAAGVIGGERSERL